MGESDSGWTSAFNVLYWPLQAFARGLFDAGARRDPDGRVDMVPVDYVADGIERADRVRGDGHVQPRGGRGAATVDELAGLACRTSTARRRRYVETGAGYSAADEYGAVYLPYFDMDVVFDDTRTRERLGLRAPPLRDYFDTLMDYADAARWGKRGSTRQEARERVAAAAG